MDERTTAVLVSFYEAVSKTNYDYMRNKYFYLVVIIIILLFAMVVYLYFKPRTRVEVQTRYVPYYIKENQVSQYH